MAPQRPAVCDNMKQSPPTSGLKKTGLAIRTSKTSEDQESRASHLSVPPHINTSIGRPGSNSFPLAIPFNKHGACVHFSGTESETSGASSPVTDMSTSFPSSTSSFAEAMQTPRADTFTKDGQHNESEDDSSAESGSDIKSEPALGELNRLDTRNLAAAAGHARVDLVRQDQAHSQIPHGRHIAHAAPGGISDYEDAGSDGPVSYSEEESQSEAESDGVDTDALDIALLRSFPPHEIGFAVRMLPGFYRFMRRWRIEDVKEKVDNWVFGPELSDTGDEANTNTRSPGPIHGGHGRGHASGTDRKRRRLSDADNDQDDYEDDGGGSGGGGVGPWIFPNESGDLLLACPFNKRDPAKYGVYNSAQSSRKDTYRACAGPGFKSIQRLKEHLKRKHTTVQCERCYRIFTGSNRSTCMKELSDHRQEQVPCERGHESLREGITQLQWERLEKQNHKKNQEKHKFERWFEIWDILFPGEDHPMTPLYNEALPQKDMSSGNGQKFVELFEIIVQRKMQGRDLDFTNPPDAIQQQLSHIAGNAFQAYVSIYGNNFILSEENSSNAGAMSMMLSAGGGTQFQQPLSDTGTHHLPMATSAQVIGGTDEVPQQENIGYNHLLQESPAELPAPPYSIGTAGMATAVDSASHESFGTGRVPAPETPAMHGQAFIPPQLNSGQPSLEDHMLRTSVQQQTQISYLTAQPVEYDPHASQASPTGHQHSHHGRHAGPPSQHSSRSRGSRSNKSSKKRDSRSERKQLPPLQPALPQGSQTPLAVASGSSQPTLPPPQPMVHTHLLQSQNQNRDPHHPSFSPGYPQSSHTSHGYGGTVDYSYGQQAAGSSMGAGYMNTHMASPRYTQFGQYSEGTEANRTPWAVEGAPSSQGHMAAQLPPINSLPFVADPTMGNQGTGNNFYQPQGSGYAGSQPGEYHYSQQ